MDLSMVSVRHRRGAFEGIWALVLLMTVLLHGGAVRKQEDPIVNTQTDPILYKEKAEEIKEGEKGAPTPSFRHYQKADFLTELPVGSHDSVRRSPGNQIPMLGDPIPEDLTGLEEDEEDWARDLAEEDVWEDKEAEEESEDAEGGEEDWWFEDDETKY